MLKKFIGNKQFYKMVLLIAVPIILQNGITNFVNLLDNIMVGQLGTEEMSAVSIVNQFTFIFNLCVFGAVSGAGIFTAQFSGRQDHEGVRQTFRFKLVVCVLIGLVGITALSLYNEPLINLFLHDGGTTGDLAKTLEFGKQYVFIIIIGLLPFALTQAYAGTLRECGQTVAPMVMSLIAVIVNLVFNAFLIFGTCGFPALGVRGAAIATVLSRFVELICIIVYTHLKKERYPFIKGAYFPFVISRDILRNILVRGTPLFLNEGLWATGMTWLNQCYSLRGLEVVASVNIASTVNNFLMIIFLSCGTALGIIVGNLLGAGRVEEAKDTDNKMIAFSVTIGVVVALLTLTVGTLFPQLYNTTESVKQSAVSLIRLLACFMPVTAFLNASYFTLRCGGRTVVTFLFDSMFVCCVAVPVAFVLAHYTALPILAIFAVVQSTDIIKCVIGFVLVKKNVWIRQII